MDQTYDHQDWGPRFRNKLKPKAALNGRLRSIFLKTQPFTCINHLHLQPCHFLYGGYNTLLNFPAIK